MTDWLNDWIEDLDWLASELPRKHVDLFDQVTEHAFLAQINHLKADLFDCDNTMVMTRLMAIIASIGDAHTALVPAVSRYLPFDFYWFAEGLYVIGATAEQQDWLGARVIAIESQPIADVIEALSEIIAHENQSFLTAQLPAFLAVADLLYGLDICGHPGTIHLTLMKSGGKPTRVTVATVGLSDRASDMIQLEEIAADPTEGNGTTLPLYRQHRNQSFWFTPVEPDLLYVQYNACKELTESPIAASFAALLATISNQHPAKIIVDLRLNLGGDSSLLDPLIDQLAQQLALQPVQQPGEQHAQPQTDQLAQPSGEQLTRQSSRLYVIIGRNTFSSALLNAFALKTKAGAILVGEPSGGKPNCFGEVQYLTLPNHKLRIRYSTKYYHLVEDDNLLSLMPDIPCPVTFADYLAGNDPCLEAIRQLA
jgi:hypothetical protein